MRTWWTAVAAGLALLVAGVSDADAQRFSPRYTVEVFGGLGDYGRFLEEQVDVVTAGPFLGARELTGESAFTLGGALGFWPWSKTEIRLGLTWANTNLEYTDDSGLDSDLLDRSDLADLSNWILSLEVLKFVLDERHRISPYATAGLVGTWWTLDDDDTDAILSSNSTQFRFGGVGGLGLQIRATERFGIRLEANIFGIGNPFDGNDSYVTEDSLEGEDPEFGPVFVIDEPSTVRFSRFTLGLSYWFGVRQR